MAVGNIIFRRPKEHKTASYETIKSKLVKNICLYFHIHHPFKLQTFRFFDIGESKTYYNECVIEKEINEAIDNRYFPNNEFIFNLIHDFGGRFKISFNITDTALDQFLIYSPRLISSFRELAETGFVEFTGCPVANSIVSLTDKEELFVENIKQGRKRTEYYFGQKPSLFVNTDLMYNNWMVPAVAKAEYAAMLTNGIGKALKWQSPNYIYNADNQQKTRILFRNEKVSDVLSAIIESPEQIKAFDLLDEFSDTLSSVNQDEPVVNIYLNYSILTANNSLMKHDIFAKFVSNIIEADALQFSLPSELVHEYSPVSSIGADEPVCWVEHFKPTYFPGNELQKEAIKQLFRYSEKMKSIRDSNLKADWYYLQSSDHFHLMDENHPDYWFKEIDKRTFKSKYEAYINFMNILSDFRGRLKIELKKCAAPKAFSSPIRMKRKQISGNFNQ